jgi:hypothetical protein
MLNVHAGLHWSLRYPAGPPIQFFDPLFEKRHFLDVFPDQHSSFTVENELHMERQRRGLCEGSLGRAPWNGAPYVPRL